MALGQLRADISTRLLEVESRLAARLLDIEQAMRSTPHISSADVFQSRAWATIRGRRVHRDALKDLAQLEIIVDDLVELALVHL